MNHGSMVYILTLSVLQKTKKSINLLLNKKRVWLSPKFKVGSMFKIILKLSTFQMCTVLSSFYFILSCFSILIYFSFRWNWCFHKLAFHSSCTNFSICMPTTSSEFTTDCTISTTLSFVLPMEQGLKDWRCRILFSWIKVDMDHKCLLPQLP